MNLHNLSQLFHENVSVDDFNCVTPLNQIVITSEIDSSEVRKFLEL